MFELGQQVQLKPGAFVPVQCDPKILVVPYVCTVYGVRHDTLEVMLRLQTVDDKWVLSEWVPAELIQTTGGTNTGPRQTLRPEAEAWTNEKLGALCREWQGAMYLSDWEVVVKYVGIREMRLKYARSECQWLTAMKQAEIRILRLEDRDPDVDIPQDPEVDLVHELEHLHWAPAFDLTEPDSAERTMLEQGIQANARAMVRLKREGETK